MSIKYVNDSTSQNIISSSDISLHDSTLASSLDEELKKQKEDISKLKSNVKWLYTYGGIGSGSGVGSGTGGSMRPWSIFATIGEDSSHVTEIVNDGNIVFGSKGDKILTVSIKFPGTSQYRLTYRVGKRSESFVNLNADNAYTFTYKVNIQDNDTIYLSVINLDDWERKIVNCNYISEPCNIVIERVLCNITTGTCEKMQSDSYTIPSVVTHVPGIKFTYSIHTANINSVKLGWCVNPQAGYNSELFNKLNSDIDYTNSGEFYPDSLENIGNNIIDFGEVNNKSVVIPLFDKTLEENGAYKAGTYTFNFNFNYNNTPIVVEPISISIIPNDIYVQLVTSNLQNFIISHEPNIDLETLGETSISNYTFKCTPFEGQMSGTRALFNLNITRYLKQGEDWREFSQQSVNIIEQTPYNVQLMYNTPGVWKTTFTLTSNKPGNNIYSVDYYIKIKTPDNVLNYFDYSFEPGVSNDYTINHQAYFKDQPGYGISWANLSFDEDSAIVDFSKEQTQEIYEVPAYSPISVQNIQTSITQKQNYILKFNEKSGLDSTTTTIISVSLQYSSSNNSETDYIFKLYTGDAVNKSNEFFAFTKNGFVHVNNGNNIANSFTSTVFPSSEYDVNDNSKYHLVQFVVQSIKKNDTNAYTSIYVYIDGIFEQVYTDIKDATYHFYGIELCNVQASYNLIDETVISYQLENIDMNNRANMDYIMYKYWLAYRSKYYNALNNISTLEEELLNSIGKYIFFDYQDVKVGTNNSITNLSDFTQNASYGFINTIAKNSNLPVLLISLKDPEVRSNGLWSDICYIDNSPNKELKFSNIPVNIYYSSGNGDLELQTPRVTDNNIIVPLFDFLLDPQGTSTLGNRSKNFTIHTKISGNTEQTLLFSPNYDENTSSTFLPEQAFNLKADVVDSGHANNTAIGKFINKFCENDKPSGYARNVSQQRVCLEGFPCLLFFSDIIHDKKTDNYNINTYYLGYYNFNLGRDSYNNLAYTTPEYVQTLKEEVKKFTGTQFKFALVQQVSNTQIGVAEITDNKSEFDFSQWDSSVLFENTDNINYGYMYGKLVSNEAEHNALKRNLIKLNKGISQIGYHLFKQIGKDFVDVYNNPFKTINKVSDPYIQYKRTSADTKVQVFDNQLPVYNSTAWEDVIKLLCTKIPGEAEGSIEDNNPIISYKYTVIYYVIILLFGLVDSIMKNLNIKTWQNLNSTQPTFYPMFYDMDTALGLDNAANESIPFFAIMDYWISEVDSEGLLKTNTVLRDYWPVESIHGYDYPGSHLYAIAKYAYAVLSKDPNVGNNNSIISELLNFTPQAMWALLRQPKTDNTNKGIFESTDYFMENFYNQGFNATTEFFISLNYKFKYGYLNLDNGVSSSGYSYFHGTRKHYVREWLNKRVHFLDAVFNINKSTNIIAGQGSGAIIEPIYTNSSLINEDKLYQNKDAQIIQDAFSADDGNAKKYPWSGQIEIEAPTFTPMVLQNSSSSLRYILSSLGTNTNTIQFSIDGNATVVPGGSKMWTSVSSLNPFAQPNMVINSDNLRNAVCDIRNNISNLRLTNCEKLENLEFRGIVLKTENKDYYELTPKNCIRNDGYTFSFPNGEANLNALQYINFGGTKIVITNINNLPALRMFNVAGNQSNQLTITNCPNLEYILFEDPRYLTSIIGYNTQFSDKIEIKDYRGSIYMEHVQCPIIKITVEEPGQTAYISGNNVLTTLELTGFETVVVENCPNLVNVTITDGANVCKNVKIQINGTRFVDGAIHVNSEESKVCDFSGLSGLENFCVAYMPFTTVKLPDKDLTFTDNFTVSINKASYEPVYNERNEIIDFEFKTGNVTVPINNPLHDCEILTNILTDYNSLVTVKCPGLFRNCKAYTGYEITLSNDDAISKDAYISKIIWDYPDLSNTFNNTSFNNYMALSHFIKKLVINKESVITMSGMFRNIHSSWGETIIGVYNWEPDFSQFISCVNYSYMFADNSFIKALRPQMLSMPGLDNINILNIVNGSTVQLDVNTFAIRNENNIGEKLTDFNIWSNTTTIELYSGNTRTNNYKELFDTLPNIKSINGINISISETLENLDFDNIFSSCTELKSITNSFNNLNWSKTQNISKLLKKNDTLYLGVNYIYNSFRGYGTTEMNISEFYDWTRLSEPPVELFNSGNIDPNMTLNEIPNFYQVTKEITLGQLKELWNKIAVSNETKSNVVSLKGIFTRMKLVLENNTTGFTDRVFSLVDGLIQVSAEPLLPIKNLKQAPFLFEKLRVYFNETEFPYVVWSLSDYTSILSYIPEVTYLYSAFAGCKFANMVPYNFFGKKNGDTYDLTLVNISKCFENVQFSTPYIGFKYNEALKKTSTYTENISGVGNTLGIFNAKYDFTEDSGYKPLNKEVYPCCPPDLLQGCVRGQVEVGTITGNETRTCEVSDIMKGWNSAGYLPDMLFKGITNAPKTMNVSNLLGDIVVLPVYTSSNTEQNTIEYYVNSVTDNRTLIYKITSNNYVYINGEGFKDLTDLSGVFNFKIHLPEYSKEWIVNSIVVNGEIRPDIQDFSQEVFYIFDNLSINWNNINSSSNILPQLNIVEKYTNTTGEKQPDIWSNFNLKLTTNLIKKINGISVTTSSEEYKKYKPHKVHMMMVYKNNFNESFKTGLPVTINNQFTFINTISGYYPTILEGKLFNQETPIENITAKNVGVSILDDIYYTGQPMISTVENYGYLSPWLILPGVDATKVSTSVNKPYIINKARTTKLLDYYNKYYGNTIYYLTFGYNN